METSKREGLRIPRLQTISAFLLFGLLAMTAPAGANPIVITEGGGEITPGRIVSYDLRGEGFSFGGRELDPSPTFLFGPCRLIACPAGTTQNFDFGIGSQNIIGVATLGSETSRVPPRGEGPSPNTRFSFQGGLVEIPPATGPFPPPRDENGTPLFNVVIVTHPFTFNGSLQTDFGLLSLVGDGTATWRLVQRDPNFFSVGSGRYEFTVIPEPSTILLLASGLGGLAALRRKNIENRSP
jgi:hypothetical protein